MYLRIDDIFVPTLDLKVPLATLQKFNITEKIKDAENSSCLNVCM